MYDEDGNEIEFEGDVERDEDYLEEEVVQKDEDEDEAWEDDSEDEAMSDKPSTSKATPKEIWDETKAPL